MGYIRSNEDYYHSIGDLRSHEQRANDLRRDADDKHLPDSIRDSMLQEARQNESDSRQIE